MNMVNWIDDDETMFEFANAMLNTLSVLSAFHLATRTANTENPVTSQSASQSLISRSHSRFRSPRSPLHRKTRGPKRGNTRRRENVMR